MKNKKIIIFIIVMFVLCYIFVIPNYSHAADLDSVISGMETVKTPKAPSGEGITTAINTVIGLIQIAGTGISVIMVTIQGIKYIIASPSDKGNVKHSAIPITIGSLLLFASVNIVKIIAETALKLE